MTKIKTLELKTIVYNIKGEKDGKEYNFIAYEMELPDNTIINMTESKINTQLNFAKKIMFEESIKEEYKNVKD